MIAAETKTAAEHSTLKSAQIMRTEFSEFHARDANNSDSAIPFGLAGNAAIDGYRETALIQTCPFLTL
jgi:hypothetical protein